MRLIFMMMIVLVLSCSPPSNVNIITINKNDISFIENWRNNGVKILKVDTLKNGNFRVYAK